MPSCIPKKASPLPCRKGFKPVGTQCYRFVRDPVDWHSAALYCGAHGAGLARYDSYVDMSLDDFYKMVPKLILKLQAHNTTISCKAGASCDIPEGKVGLSVEVNDKTKAEECEGKVALSADMKNVLVKTGCSAEIFKVSVVDQKVYESPKPVVTWVGGNTKVLKVGERSGQTPYQVDAPRMAPAASNSTQGCFMALLHNGTKLDLQPNPDCNDKLPFICGYDNRVDYD
ncbi:hypothetical protein EGW08_021731, partial [Elysia chlorotica]